MGDLWYNYIMKNKPTLQERCQSIYEKDGIEQKKIDWLIASLTPEAIENSDAFSDEQILSGRVHLLWYGLADALLANLEWEKEQI